MAVDFKFRGKLIEIGGDGSRLDTTLAATSIGNLIQTDTHLPQDGPSTNHQGVTLLKQGPHGRVLVGDVATELNQTGLHLVDKLPNNLDTTSFSMDQLRQGCTGEIHSRIQLGSDKILPKSDFGVVTQRFSRLGRLKSHNVTERSRLLDSAGEARVW